jgi:hypothetical protein
MNRKGMIATIQIEFPKTRPDLDPQTDAGELRAARLEFCRVAANLKHTPESLTNLSDYHLMMVLDRLTEVRGQKLAPRPTLTGCNVRQVRPKTKEAIEQMGLAALAATENAVGCGVADSGSPQSGVIVHLAGNEQVWAIRRVVEYLDWNERRKEQFISSRFGTKSEKMLRGDDPKKLLYLLLLCAAHRDLKVRLGPDVKITRDQEKGEIPAIKRKLGIDR